MIVTVPRLARFLAAATCRSRLDGAHHLPSRGPALLVVNHTTIADVPVVLGALGQNGLVPAAADSPGHGPHCDHAHLRFLATRDVMVHPLIGRMSREAGFIAVEPAGPGRIDAYVRAE